MDSNNYKEKFRRARVSGTPLIALSSPDPFFTMEQLHEVLGDSVITYWDCINGLRHRNKSGEQAINALLGEGGSKVTINPTECVKIIAGLPQDSVVFMLNAHHFMDRPDFLQACGNLRDIFKSKQCTLCFVGPEFTPPLQLKEDIFPIDEPLPADEHLTQIIKDITDDAIEVAPDVVEKATAALRGLSAFAAETCVAMNTRKEGLDVQGIWERKRKLISSTQGLRAYDGKETFDDIGGCDQVKKFLKGIIRGKEAPNLIVFIDEGEKMFAGATGDVGDSSGVAQDFLGTTLSKMEDNQWDGVIFVGPPGAAKSAISKAIGNEAGIPTIMMDMGAMKGGLVGKSEQQIRAAYKVIEAVGGGQVFFVMTCNKIVNLPPELRRRFSSGTFFFDLPTREERLAIWSMYINKYGIKGVPAMIDFDEGWTGAEIRNCCRMAYRQEISIVEAADFIVPVSRSAPQQILDLRQRASGAYLSANTVGVYNWKDPNEVKAGKRQVKVD